MAQPKALDCRSLRLHDYRSRVLNRECSLLLLVEPVARSYITWRGLPIYPSAPSRPLSTCGTLNSITEAAKGVVAEQAITAAGVHIRHASLGSIMGQHRLTLEIIAFR